MPSRTPPRLDVDMALAHVRRNAVARAENRWSQVETRLHRDGKADRAAMGNPDPTLGQVLRGIGSLFRPPAPINDSYAWGGIPLTTDLDRTLAAAVRERRHRAAVDRVFAAWTVAGPHPAYHRRHRNRLRAQWPVLADALDELAQATRTDRT